MKQLALLGAVLFCTPLSLFQSFTSLSFSSSTSTAIAIEDEGCHAKCIIPDQFEMYEEEYAIFTGDEAEEDVDLELVNIELKPAGTTWEKKKADRLCNAPDPEDCLVWCLVEHPAEIRTIKVLKDLSQSDNYVMETISRKELFEKGGFTDWREVLCAEKITPKIVHQIQDALRDLGFYKGKNSKHLNKTTKAALNNYQRKNNLPMGHLDFETLEALNVELN